MSDVAAIQRGEAAPLNLGYVNKLLASFRRATESHCDEVIGWYKKAHTDIQGLALELGLPHRNVAYAVAALSNQLNWNRNVEAVRQLANGFDAQGMRGPVEKAKACLAGDLSALRGPKVTSFALALTGSLDESVIDRWIMRILNGRDTKKISPTPKQYGRITKALRVAAKMVDLPVGHFQAIVWLQVRSAS